MQAADYRLCRRPNRLYGPARLLMLWQLGEAGKQVVFQAEASVESEMEGIPLRILTATFCLLIVSTLVDISHAQPPAEPGGDSEVTRIEECVVKLADERSLASGQSGIIEKVHVREGDRVKKGQLLAELDARVPLAALAVAQTQADNDVNERFAVAAAEVAEAEYASVKASREKNRSSFAWIQEEKYRLERDRSRVEIEVAQHETKINEQRRDEAAALVATYRIYAPMDGVISRVYKAPGEAVQVGETLLECQNTEMIHVEANVKVHLLDKVRRGGRVRIVPDRKIVTAEGHSRAAEITGTVFFVGVLAELSSETVRVLVEAENRDGRLLAGTTAVLEVIPVLETSRAGTAQRD